MKYVAVTDGGCWEELGDVHVYAIADDVDIDQVIDAANAQNVAELGKCVLVVAPQVVMGPGGMGDLLSVVTYDECVNVDHG